MNRKQQQGKEDEDFLEAELNLQKELENVKNMASEFGMIRFTENGEDFGVDNIELNEDDINDPSLLSELLNMQDNENNDIDGDLVDEGRVKKDLEEQVKAARSRALALKRSGDIEGAKDALEEYELLKEHLSTFTEDPIVTAAATAVVIISEDKVTVQDDQPSTTQRTDEQLADNGEVDEVTVLKALALAAKKEGDIELAKSYMAQVFILQGRSGKSIPSILQDQQKQCRKAAEVCMSLGLKSDASDWLRKEQALGMDVNTATKLKKKAKTRVISVTLPVDNSNKDLRVDELRITLNNLVLNEKCTIVKSSGKFMLTSTIAFPTEHTQQSEPFALNTDSVTLSHTVSKGPRSIRFVEHHKTRLDLYSVESGFFRSKNIPVGYAMVKLAPLISDATVESNISFVDENRRPVHITADLVVQSRVPFRGEDGRREEVAEWTILVDGELDRILNPPVINTDEEDGLDDISLLVSFVVLEDEINRVKGDPNPSNSDRLQALEMALETLMVQVDLGQLSMEDYLDRLSKAILDAKQRALQAKHANNLKQAKIWLKRVKLMETELSEAQES